jgi:hypothetical protein
MNTPYNGLTERKLTMNIGQLTALNRSLYNIREAKCEGFFGKLHAIAIIRKVIPGMGLKEAKEYVESLGPEGTWELPYQIPALGKALSETPESKHLDLIRENNRLSSELGDKVDTISNLLNRLEHMEGKEDELKEQLSRKQIIISYLESKIAKALVRDWEEG